MALTEEQRIELYNFALKIGFIIKGVEDWSDDKKKLKIFKLIGQGFRIRDFGDKFEVINILDKEFSDRKRKMIEDLYMWLNTPSQTKR